MRYQQIRKALYEQPWTIMPSALAVVAEVVELRLSGVTLSQDDLEARLDQATAQHQARDRAGDDFASSGSKIAVLPLRGVLIPRADLMTEISGGTSLETWGKTFDSLVASPDIATIVIDVDSPGGSVPYTEETAAKIAAGSAQKQVIAVANHTAGSGAYWLASQASELVMTPSGQVGSIGVLAIHEDVTALQEKVGIKTTMLTAGEHKDDFWPFKPLDESTRAYVQTQLDVTYDKFVDAVASGRDVKASAVRSLEWGQGRVLFAAEALRVGMVDRVATLEQVIHGLLEAPPSRSALGARLSISSVTAEADLAEISARLRQATAIVKGTP